MLLLTALAAASLAAQTLDEARALHAQRRLPEAVSAYRAAAEASASTDPATAATARNNACVLLNELGDFREALKDCEVALRIRRLQGDPIRLARTLNNAGMALHRLNNFRDAEARFQEALEINRQHGDAEGQVINLSNLGLVAASQGRLNRALGLQQTAERLASLHAAEPWAAGQSHLCRMHRGAILENLGDNAGALDLYRSLLEDKGALDPRRLAVLLVHTGAVYRGLGDSGSAETSLREAIAIFEAQGDQAGLASAWLNLGLVHHLVRRDPGAAENAYQRALAFSEQGHDAADEIQGRFYLGRLFLEQGRIDEAEQSFARCLEAARSRGSAEGTWSALNGLGRTAAARGTDEGDQQALQLFDQAMAEIDRFPVSPLRSALRSQFFGERRPVYAAAVELLARMEAREPGAGHAEAALAIVQRAKVRELLDALGGSGSAASAQSVDRLREKIGDGLLLEYFLGEKNLFLWVIRSGNVRLADLGPYDSILADSMAVHEALSRRRQPDGAQLARLSKTLLSPAGEMGAGPVWIAPDGFLRYLPFELFPDLFQSGELRSYLPTGSALAWPDLLLGGVPPVFTLIGFGAPDVPAGAKELESLSELLPGRHELFSGPDASEETLRRYVVDGARIVHLAAPAVIDEQPGHGAAILLAPSDADDGVLYPEDIGALEYRADLTVLASGRISHVESSATGNALATLTGAFLASGSPGVIATLWNVDPEGNAAFLEQLYRELGKGRRPAEALSLTKRRFRDDPRWPGLWAAYVMIGDPPRVAYTDRLRYAVGALLLAALALTPVYLDRRRERRKAADGTAIEASE